MSEPRVINIPGTSNFRDFGGYSSSHSQTMPAGRFFRSAHLGRVGAEGRQAIRRLGITTVIDLRGVHERQNQPLCDAGLDDIRVISTPIEPQAQAEFRALRSEGLLNGERARNIMLRCYQNFVTRNIAEWGLVLRAIRSAGNSAFVVHCAAGKDRTGFLVSLILAIAGVSSDDIMADYVMTNTAWDGASSITEGFDIEVNHALSRADPSYLEAALSAIKTDHGSVETFVAAATGEAGFPDRLVRGLTELRRSPTGPNVG